MTGKSSVGLLGCGNMGSILLKSLVSLAVAAPHDISVYDPDPKVRREAEKLKVRFSSSARGAVRGKRIVILAVKPQIIPSLVSEIKEDIEPDSVVISIAAGISTEKIKTLLQRDQKVVRAMPNTPALIKKGMTGIAFSGTVIKEEKGTVRRIFNRLGRTVVLPEEKMDAVTALSGSGPAYLFAFVDALVAGGIRIGLTETVAYKMATQTVFGAVKMLIQMDLSPAEQIRKVTSPGGTTLAGLSILEKREFRETVMAAMEAARDRASELGREAE